MKKSLDKKGELNIYYQRKLRYLILQTEQYPEYG